MDSHNEGQYIQDSNISYERILTKEKLMKGLKHPKTALIYIFNMLKYRYYRIKFQDDYDKLYLKVTKSNVKDNPEASVGPEESFETMREWQHNFLIQKGLKPSDNLLDIGCGVLRGGIKFIDYLNSGNYYGIDISKDVLEIGQQQIEERNLEDKKPTLIQNKDLKFKEEELNNVVFDFVWAQSVLTHLPPNKVEECFENIGRLLNEGGIFYATVWLSEEMKRDVKGTDFHYSLDFLHNTAKEQGLTLKHVECDHPNNLDMLKITK